ncbi:GCR1-dependent translation factor 1 [Conoideocrella luteorostrata]|uniref:GCR1-dependent translation factor 1 n=1 Tax=Conoideocrella luteorostrata TaxID=1105319 RepID=A0AAJ0FUJ6_9HYPO|nr:GCR1-dependent translation factor 1 [Conoideocrella luteorostrata]
MRFQTTQSPLLLLLLPSLAAGLSPRVVPSVNAGDSKSLGRTTESRQADDAAKPKSSTGGRYGVATKAAPVDGKDGKPHLGPFVETDGVAVDAKGQKLPQLKGRPADPTLIDGQKIPKSNDGVMFDKNRDRPEKGISTGTEGGVTEKDKARKEKEGKTGEKAVTKPEAPKEQPPLPHSEERKLYGSKEEDTDKAKLPTHKEAGSTDYTGLDKPDDLPDSPRDKSKSTTGGSIKDHLETLSPNSKETIRTKPKTKISIVEDKDDGIIQPFHSWVLSFTMILVSEIGDKTFLVAALMAMKHDRMVVFSAAFGALLVMTVLSAVLGHAVPTLIPKRLTSFLAAGLFFIFGAKLLNEGMKMDPNEGVSAEMHEVEQELAEKEKEMGRGQNGGISAYNLEMGLGGRNSRSKSRFPSPPRSPSQSPSRSPSRRSGSMTAFFQGIGNLCSLLLSPAWVQTFVMTFLGEWGDRSQIATIAMAAGQDYWWVTLGATCGHAICTGVAVIGGRAIAGRVSLRIVTVGGAVAFLIFGIIYFFEALYA